MKNKTYNENDMPDSRDLAKSDKKKIKTKSRLEAKFKLKVGTAIFSFQNKEKRARFENEYRNQLFERFGKTYLSRIDFEVIN